MSFKILGTGSSLPSRAVSNEELSEFLDTSDEWISQRVGIRERRVCTTERTADLAHDAALKALDMSGVEPHELDLILCATVSADNSAPSLACSVQSMLGATCPAMDINAACSGFIYMLDTAAGFFARGKAGKALVIGAERLSRMLDWTDRGTAVIFGDGAGAMVLGPGDSYLASKLFARGNDTVLGIPNSDGASPYYENEPRHPFIFMNGQETFKFAVKAMSTDLEEVVEAAGLGIDDIAWIVPHQANARIIDSAVKKLGLDPERCLKNIERVGNTSAASVPILADELWRSGKLRDGDYIAMCSFGAGLTSAACIIRWEA
ncbi:MAG: ketoacyl-ACP synthase III [Oscillospiraceae bacterium]|nr:ketoacyl-ACP synthase III [Oscillospiraceae bacterium]